MLLYPQFILGQTEVFSIKKTSFSKEGIHEFSPFLYRNGIVFSANYSAGLSNYTTTDNEGLYNIFYADSLGKVTLFSKELNSKLNDGPACFNLAGDTIFYSRNLIINGSTKELSSPKNNLGIYSSTLINGKWTNINRFEHNNSYYNLSFDVTSPALAPDSKRLYFASDMPGGYGGLDLYYSDLQNGVWGNPVNLGPIINTSGNEGYPFVNALGELLFSSDGHPGYGKKDIFISYFNGSEWEKPNSMPPPINSEFDDFGITTDELMSKGYFSSKRGSSVDIYEFQAISSAVFFCKPQKDINYCYSFELSDPFSIDTSMFYYLWDLGDGTKIKGLDIKHCYNSSGSYKISLNLMDLKTEKIFLIVLESQINIRKKEQVHLSCPNSGIAGERMHFDAIQNHLPGYEVLAYSWDFGDGTFSSNAITEHNFIKDSTYEVKLGVFIKSSISGKLERKSVSKKIIIFSDEQDKLKHDETNWVINTEYPVYSQTKSVEVLTLNQISKNFHPENVFVIAILDTTVQIENDDPKFQPIIGRYNVKNVWDKLQESYIYYVDRQFDALSLHQTFLQIQNLGYTNSRIRQIDLNTSSDIELMGLIKTYGNSVDTYFDKSGQLTSTAYIMLNQLVKLMNSKPELRIEIIVHTDSQILERQNLSLSKSYAITIADYLITRGISSAAITTKGMGNVRPIASNSSESELFVNRRIDFLLSEE